jgi:hypothetical protein
MRLTTNEDEVGGLNVHWDWKEPIPMDMEEERRKT